MHRLLAALEVNDGEAAHGEADARAMIKPIFIRATMANSLAHPCQHDFVYRITPPLIYNSYDPAHDQFPFATLVVVCHRRYFNVNHSPKTSSGILFAGKNNTAP